MSIIIYYKQLNWNLKYRHFFDPYIDNDGSRNRIARAKKMYERIHNEPEQQLDLLIVVDQMLTGFDSKWLNNLYLDKVIKYQKTFKPFHVPIAYLAQTNLTVSSVIIVILTPWNSTSMMQ